MAVSVERYMKLVKELGLRPNSVYGAKKPVGALKKARPSLTFTETALASNKKQ